MGTSFSQGKAPVLLLVDDDYDWAFIFRGQFQKIAPEWEVVCAPDGMEAINELAKLSAPQALVTDLGMPGMSGMELIQWVKDQPEYRLLPIFVLSNNPTQHQRCVVMGIHSFMDKPRSLQDLQNSIRQIIRVCVEDRLPASESGEISCT